MKEKIYLVVVYHTLLNAQIVEQSQAHSAAGGKLAIFALAASGVIIPLPNPVNPRFSGFRGTIESEKVGSKHEASIYMLSKIARFVGHGFRAKRPTRQHLLRRHGGIVTTDQNIKPRG